MNTITDIIIGMFLLVGGSVLIGELFEHLGQVALVGQLLVGVILGPTLLAGPLGLTTIASSFQALQILATFFILVMAGMAITPQQIRATGVASGLCGIAIFVIPFVAGAYVVHGIYPGLSTTEDLFISLTISITALPVLGVMLREFNILETRLGSFLMNTAMVNELSAVTTFAVLLQVYNHPGSLGVSIATALGTTALFLGSILAVYFVIRGLRRIKVWDRWAVRFRESWRSRQGGFAILMVVGLACALYSQYLGLTYVVGAFYCGLLLTPETTGRREHRSISFIFEAITWGFFIPLFFALIGLQMNLRDIGLAEVPILAFFALGAFALFSKIFVGAGVARALGWSANESLLTGFLVTSRGAVELAMAVILLDLGIFSTKIFTIVAGVGLLATFISPIGAKPFVRVFTGARRTAAGPSPPSPLEPAFPQAER
ncbi:MAG TPA: cation:proton antiporter [Thermoplasmata archaeon]|nr:cation:proton antiporter [Thermoplasmata archaeon]